VPQRGFPVYKHRIKNDFAGNPDAYIVPELIHTYFPTMDVGMKTSLRHMLIIGFYLNKKPPLYFKKNKVGAI